MAIREILAEAVLETVARLFREANYFLPDDVVESLKEAAQKEQSPLGRRVIDVILQNAQLAASKEMPLCQDTGTAVIFLELGQDVHITGDLNRALLEGVGKGYTGGFLRSSIVKHPFSSRINTKDNTPPVVHTEIVPGDSLKITVMPKGGGCENMSRMAILKPAEGKKGITDLVLRTVVESGGNPCPPVIVGVGIGGSSEMCMLLAKKALLRRVQEPSGDPEVAEFERELLEVVNSSGVGPQAYGGTVTALAVHVETYPCHITALPVAVNLQCHSARLKQAVL